MPVQVLADGVTVMVAIMGSDPVLVAVKLPMSPEPLALIPIAVLEFAQV